MQIIDIRMNSVVGCLKDKNLTMVGDISVQRSDEGKVKLGVSGVGGYSIWEISCGMNESTHLDGFHASRSSMLHSSTSLLSTRNKFNPSKAHHIPLLQEEYVSQVVIFISTVCTFTQIAKCNLIARISRVYIVLQAVVGLIPLWCLIVKETCLFFKDESILFSYKLKSHQRIDVNSLLLVLNISDCVE